jgi:hypothetical protein
MAQVLNEQFIKMQKLAGVLTEERHALLRELLLEGAAADLVDDPTILALAAKIVKQPVDKVEAVLTGKEQKQDDQNQGKNLQESWALTIVLALPMLLEAGGSLANLIKRKYGLSEDEMREYEHWESVRDKLEQEIDSYGDPDESLALTDPSKRKYYDSLVYRLEKHKEKRDEKFGSSFGNFLNDAGHGLHSLYTSPIRALLWVISLFTPSGSDLRNSTIREKIANIIYAAGMIIFAGKGILKSIKHLSGVPEAAHELINGSKAGKSVAEMVEDVPIVANAFAT